MVGVSCTTSFKTRSARGGPVRITGFQAPGTLGRRLVDRASEVRIHGQTLRLRAKVHTVGGLSAHGDQGDLLRWYGSFAGRPSVCLVHGEREPAHALQQKIDKLGGKAIVPKPGARLNLAAMTMTSRSE